jgi:hypothetical protein
MKQTVTLTITSLLSILLVTLHLTHDIVHKISPGKLSNLNAIIVLAVWAYAALVLAEKRSGYIIMLVMSVLASGVPVLHMSGTSGMTAGIKSVGAYFFAWTLYALGVTAVLSVFLSARGLWSLRRGRAV